MAVYEGDGAQPKLARFPEAAHADEEFVKATELRGRIFNVHVRRAQPWASSASRTHIRSASGNYTLGHNGTIVRYPRLLEPGMRQAEGDTDSEHLFNRLMHDFDPAAPVESLRATLSTTVHCSPFSGLNILFSDGEKLFAYRLGMFELHWLARPWQPPVASERVTDEPGWHSVQQDVLLTLDPNDLEEPHAERLLGDEIVHAAEIQKVDLAPHLRGAERGQAAAERARAAAAAG